MKQQPSIESGASHVKLMRAWQEQVVESEVKLELKIDNWSQEVTEKREEESRRSSADSVPAVSAEVKESELKTMLPLVKSMNGSSVKETLLKKWKAMQEMLTRTD